MHLSSWPGIFFSAFFFSQQQILIEVIYFATAPPPPKRIRILNFEDFGKLSFFPFFFACHDFLDESAPYPLSKTMPRACESNVTGFEGDFLSCTIGSNEYIVHGHTVWECFHDMTGFRGLYEKIKFCHPRTISGNGQ